MSRFYLLRNKKSDEDPVRLNHPCYELLYYYLFKRINVLYYVEDFKRMLSCMSL